MSVGFIQSTSIKRGKLFIWLLACSTSVPLHVYTASTCWCPFFEKRGVQTKDSSNLLGRSFGWRVRDARHKHIRDMVREEGESDAMAVHDRESLRVMVYERALHTIGRVVLGYKGRKIARQRRREVQLEEVCEEVGLVRTLAVVEHEVLRNDQSNKFAYFLRVLTVF